MDSPPERRRTTRITTSIAARLIAENGKPAALQLVNLSVVGLFGEALVTWETGTRCRVELDSSGVLIEARATVVRSGKRELALRFENLPYESYVHLRAFLLANAEDPAVIANELSERLGFLDEHAA